MGIILFCSHAIDSVQLDQRPQMDRKRIILAVKVISGFTEIIFITLIYLEQQLIFQTAEPEILVFMGSILHLEQESYTKENSLIDQK